MPESEVVGLTGADGDRQSNERRSQGIELRRGRRIDHGLCLDGDVRRLTSAGDRFLHHRHIVDSHIRRDWPFHRRLRFRRRDVLHEGVKLQLDEERS